MFRDSVLLAFALALASGVAAAGEDARRLAVSIDPAVGQPVVSVEMEGRTLRLVVDIAGPRAVILNGSVASEMRLRTRGLLSRIIDLGATMEIDGERYNGETAKHRLRLTNGVSFRRRVVWFPGREVVSGVDGVIGLPAFKEIAHLDILREGEREAGEREAGEPTAVFEGDLSFTFRAPVMIEGVAFKTEFSMLSPTHSGQEEWRWLRNRGLVARRPDRFEEIPIWFGVRPAAAHYPAQGLSLSGFAAESLAVPLHTERFLEVQRLEEIAASRTGETMTVTAKETFDIDAFRMTFGRDLFVGCRRLRFDFEAEALSLFC